MFTCIFSSILVPTWLYFGSPNLAKSSQKSIPRGINFLIDFYIDLLSIFVRFWTPTWGHVDHIFAQNGGALWRAPVFFVVSMLFFDFFGHPGPLLAPCWVGWGSSFSICWSILVSMLEGFGVQFGGFWWLFGSDVLNLFGEAFCLLRSGSGWAGGVTRSVKNYTH